MIKKIGRIKWYSNIKLFGFITGEDEVEYYFNYKNVNKQIGLFRENMLVSFEPFKTERGFVAENVSLPTEFEEKRYFLEQKFNDMDYEVKSYIQKKGEKCPYQFECSDYLRKMDLSYENRDCYFYNMEYKYTDCGCFKIILIAKHIYKNRYPLSELEKKYKEIVITNNYFKENLIELYRHTEFKSNPKYANYRIKTDCKKCKMYKPVKRIDSGEWKDVESYITECTLNEININDVGIIECTKYYSMRDGFNFNHNKFMNFLDTDFSAEELSSILMKKYKLSYDEVVKCAIKNHNFGNYYLTLNKISMVFPGVFK